MKSVFNPFEKYSEKALLMLGVLLLGLGSLTGALFNARYDGVIDMHLNPYVLPAQPFIDNVINTVALFVVLYILGHYINKKTRPVDILNATLIARSPFYLLPLFNINNFLANQTPDPSALDPYSIDYTQLIVPLLFSIPAIAFLVWFVILLYNGFKTASNCKTTAHKVWFALCIIIAEIAASLLISYIPY